MQQVRALVSLLVEIRFKWKKRTHKECSNLISMLNWMVPLDVIGIVVPVGRFTKETGHGVELINNSGVLLKY